MKRETFKSRTRKLLGGGKGRQGQSKKQTYKPLDLSQVEPLKASKVLPSEPRAASRMEVTIDLIREIVSGSTEIATANREKIKAFIKDYESAMKHEPASKGASASAAANKKSTTSKAKGAKSKSDKKTKKNKGSAATAAAQGPAPQTDNGISLFFNILKAKRTEYIKVFKSLVSDFVKPAQTTMDEKLETLYKELKAHKEHIPQLKKDIEKIKEDIDLLKRQIANSKTSAAPHKQEAVSKKEAELKNKEEELESKKGELEKAESEFENKKGKIEGEILDIKNLQIDVHNFIYLPKTPADFEMYNTKYGLDYLLDTEEYKNKVVITLNKSNPGDNIAVDDLITYVFDSEIFNKLVDKVGRDASGKGEAYFYDREGGFKVISSDNLQHDTDPEHYERFHATKKADILKILKKAFEYEFDAKKFEPKLSK